MLFAVALILPLCLDTFAIAAAAGALRPTRRQRLRLTAIFVAFEAGMPLVGFALGAVVARALANRAALVAALLAGATGIWVLAQDDDAEERRVERLTTISGAGVLGLGLAVSVDELALGVSLGLLRVPIVLAIALIALQAAAAAQLGLALGGRIAEVARERAEKAAGVLLILVAVALGVEALLGR